MSNDIDTLRYRPFKRSKGIKKRLLKRLKKPPQKYKKKTFDDISKLIPF